MHTDCILTVKKCFIDVPGNRQGLNFWLLNVLNVLCCNFRGDREVIEEFKVGPLPEPTSHTIIKNPTYKDPIPYYMRSTMADHELRLWEAYMKQELTKMEDVLKAATDGSVRFSVRLFKCKELYYNNIFSCKWHVLLTVFVKLTFCFADTHSAMTVNLNV